jgi:hypothetical protein
VNAATRTAGIGGAVVAYAGAMAGLPALAAAGVLVETVCVVRVLRHRHGWVPRLGIGGK